MGEGEIPGDGSSPLLCLLLWGEGWDKPWRCPRPAVPCAWKGVRGCVERALKPQVPGAQVSAVSRRAVSQLGEHPSKSHSSLGSYKGARLLCGKARSSG